MKEFITPPPEPPVTNFWPKVRNARTRGSPRYEKTAKSSLWEVPPASPADIAWDLLFQRKNPSWLYSIDNGATTIWERWNSYTIESGMGPKGMNSFNHYAYGCVCQWLWETAAGIAADSADSGFKHIIMKPIPDLCPGIVYADDRLRL